MAGERAAVLTRAANYLVNHLDDAAAQLTAEQGKTLTDSRHEFLRAIDTLRWRAESMGTFNISLADGSESCVIVPEPIGVVGAFTPWNYPAVIIARKLGAALSAGCTVVLKGAEEAPGAAVQIAQSGVR